MMLSEDDQSIMMMNADQEESVLSRPLTLPVEKLQVAIDPDHTPVNEDTLMSASSVDSMVQTTAVEDSMDASTTSSVIDMNMNREEDQTSPPISLSIPPTPGVVSLSPSMTPLLVQTEGLVTDIPVELALPSPSRQFESTVFIAQQYPEDLSAGLSEIAKHCLHRNFITKESMMTDQDSSEHYTSIRFVLDESLDVGALRVNSVKFESDTGPSIVIRYKRKVEAFRALGLVLTAAFSPEDHNLTKLSFSEKAQFDTMGLMIDCSRGAVMRVKTVMSLLRQAALLGMNTFQLYTEDTYQVEGEPFFGFCRGVYTSEELVAIDNYADNLGIEVFPCIQTLGHLGQILQWPPYYPIKDNSEVLLANSGPTYAFIEKLIQTISKCFRSRRIHIGMDEAHGVGEGRYRQLLGDKDARDIFLDHLQRVHEICKSHDLDALIWSDMLFTLTSHNAGLQGYYDDLTLPRSVSRSMPNDIKLVYWDYYHTQEDIYSRKIQQHRDAGYDPWVAGGIWTWNRLFSALPFTFDATKACLSACKKQNIRNVFATIWGDDGNECDVLSALPGIAYFATHGYTPDYEVDWALLRNSFGAICGGRLGDWMCASKIDSVPSLIPRRDKFPPNPSKWILWQDPFYGFLGSQYAEFDLATHFSEIHRYLESATSSVIVQKYPLNARLTYPSLIAQVLALKCNFRVNLEKAYKSPSDTQLENLQAFVRDYLDPLQAGLEALWKYHRDRIWLQTYKPFGLEIIEMRYGAIRTRLASLRDRLEGFCVMLKTKSYGSNSQDDLDNDDVIGFPELDVNVSQEIYPGFGMDLVFDFSRAYTPSRALGTG